MIRGIRSTVLPAAALLCAAAVVMAGAPAPTPTSTTDSSVWLKAALEKPDSPVYAGEPVDLAITLKNTTGKPLMVLDWDRFDEELVIAVGYESYPGATDKHPGPVMDTTWEPAAIPMKNDYRQLPPGDTVIHRTLTLLLPGKATVGVRWKSPTDKVRSSGNGKEKVQENAYVAGSLDCLTLTVAAEMSPAMKKRYEDVQRQLDDPIIPSDQKGQLLNIVGTEKHYFAAKFLQGFVEKEPAGPIRDAAVWQLLKLLKVGTAYEAIPLVLERMLDASTIQDTRVAVLDWTAAALAGGAKLDIAGQATYEWPAALQKQAREAIQKMTEDDNPYLASHAKDALRKTDAAAPAK